MSGATRVYLVRHGATNLTAENRFSGDAGAELSEEGRWQTERLGERLRRENVQAIYCSPLSRAADTAAILGRRCGLAPVSVDDLREIRHGRWEGLTRQEVEERFPGEYEAWEEDPFTFAPEGGESGVAVLARALPALRAIITAHPRQRVVIVSHKATIRILISSLLGFDARGYRDRLDQAPACLNVLDFRDPVHVRLMLFNDTSHYSERPRVPAENLSKWWDRGETEQLRHSWVANAESWLDAVRGGKIASRRLGTDSAIVNAVMDLQPERVLDLGCGEGWLVRELGANGVEAWGVDASAPLIDAAVQQGGGVFHALSYEELLRTGAMPRASFDVVVANFAILEEDVRPVMTAAARMLRPGGTFVMQTVHPVAAAPEGRYVDGWTTETFASFEGHWPEPMPWYFRTIGSWVDVLRDNGFAVAAIREPVHPEQQRPLSIIFLSRLQSPAG